MTAGRNPTSKRVLIVDDEQLLRRVASRCFTLLGHQTLLADSGEECLTQLQEASPPIDLVFLDLHMPGMGGEACLKQILTRHERPKILVTSGAPPSILLDARCGFLPKPYTRAELTTAVRDLVGDAPR